MPSLEERRLLRALHAGDEDSYASLHARYHAQLVALAVAQGCSRAVAQEAAQETWAAVMRGVHTFEGRCTLKTWIFRILDNIARAQARRERRSIPASALDENVIDLAEARGRVAPPPPDELMLWKETLVQLRGVLESLPPSQRRVIVLRDLRGWSAEEVRAHLELSDANQRVLLHRARARVRAALANHLGRDAEAA